jgi:hypothetical protein
MYVEATWMEFGCNRHAQHAQERKVQVFYTHTHTHLASWTARHVLLVVTARHVLLVVTARLSW